MKKLLHHSIECLRNLEKIIRLILTSYFTFFLVIGLTIFVYFYFNLESNDYDLFYILTFIAAFFYALYTYEILDDQKLIDASIILSYPDNNYDIKSRITNHTKYSIICDCNLEISLDGINFIKLDKFGFYSGEKPMSLSPRNQVNGHFGIKDLISKMRNYDDIYSEILNDQNVNVDCYVKVNFCYTNLSKTKKIVNPPHIYKYSIRNNSWMLDV